MERELTPAVDSNDQPRAALFAALAALREKGDSKNADCIEDVLFQHAEGPDGEPRPITDELQAAIYG